MSLLNLDWLIHAKIWQAGHASDWIAGWIGGGGAILGSVATCSVRPLTGMVVKRDFEDDGTTLKGFVVEHAEGTREYINADGPTGLDTATGRAIYDGLERLTKVGRRVSGKVLACGVADAVMSVETIR